MLSLRACVSLLAILVAATQGAPEMLAKSRVAICGAGMSGCAAANLLEASGLFDVTLFEVGRGAGGRTSTRRQAEFSFDHGAPSVASVVTEEFRTALVAWESAAVVGQWNPTATTLRNRQLSAGAQPRAHYVGTPAMNSICKHLVAAESIGKEFQLQGAMVKETSGRWTVRDDAGASRGGEFDVVVCADRNAVKEGRPDLASPSSMEAVGGFVELVRRHVSSRPALIAMLAFSEPLAQRMGEYVTVSDNDVLSLLVRDTSKPGRERADGRECWVLHSTAALAEQVIKSVASEGGGKESVAERAASALSAEFLSLLSENSVREGAEVVFLRGHRWSAAFPVVDSSFTAAVAELQGATSDGEARCYVDEENCFAACGDYFFLPGTIEGAYLSGKAVADSLISLKKKKL